MKYLIIIVLFSSSLSMAQEKQGQDIIVHITNFDSNDGKVRLGLFDSEANWLDKSIMGKVVEIHEKSCSVTFENLPSGIYAISLYHDENDNKKLDTNFLGIPKEDTGSSNNAPARFGPPKWKDAKFELKKQTKIINIKL